MPSLSYVLENYYLLQLCSALSGSLNTPVVPYHQCASTAPSLTFKTLVWPQKGFLKLGKMVTGGVSKFCSSVSKACWWSESPFPGGILADYSIRMGRLWCRNLSQTTCSSWLVRGNCAGPSGWWAVEFVECSGARSGQERALLTKRGILGRLFSVKPNETSSVWVLTQQHRCGQTPALATGLVNPVLCKTQLII